MTPNHSNTTLASVGFRARRIEPVALDMELTRADRQDAAQHCTTFLDQCAAEAFANRWFPKTPITMRRRSTIMERVLAIIAEHGPLTAQAIMPLLGHERSATEKAIREWRQAGRLVVVGHLPTMGRAQIYGLPEKDV